MEEIAKLIVGELKDPGLAGVVITRVVLSEDLRNAKVYFTTFEEGREKEAVRALERAKPYIRSYLIKSLRLKRLPELYFIFDEELRRMERIWQRL